MRKIVLFMYFNLLFSCNKIIATNYYVNDGYTTGDVFCFVGGVNHIGIDAAGRGMSASTPVLTLRYLFNLYSALFTSGDVIYIDAGTYSTTGFAATDEANFIITTSGITFQGTGVGKTIFDHNFHGPNTDFFMWIKANNVSVKDMTVREYTGGASNSGITVASVNTGGQAFTVGTGTSTISGILLQNVQTYDNAGTGNAAIAIQPMTTATITGGGSTCNAYGGSYAGGIDVYGTAINLVISNYLVSYNSKSAGFFGGGLYTYAADNTTNISVTKTRFYSNTTSSEGGAMCFRGGNITIKNCMIDSNIASANYGGGIYITKGTLAISNSKFSKNSGSKGGAICVNANEGHVNLTIDTCVFQLNTAVGYSDVYVRRSGPTYNAFVTMRDCRFLSTGTGSNYNIFNYDGATPISDGAANIFNVTYFGTAPNKGGNALTSFAASPHTVYTPIISTPSFTGACGAVLILLPIELVRFEGDCQEGDIILNWETASEKNNLDFEVERSNDGISFEIIGKVNGLGNRESNATYSFTDTSLNEGMVYYRLTQSDYNGKRTESKIVSVSHDCDKKQDAIITLFPNPSEGNSFLKLKLFYPSSISVYIYNHMGQLVNSYENLKFEKGFQTYPLDFSSVKSGIYFIKTVINNQEQIHKYIKL